MLDTMRSIWGRDGREERGGRELEEEETGWEKKDGDRKE